MRYKNQTISGHIKSHYLLILDMKNFHNFYENSRLDKKLPIMVNSNLPEFNKAILAT